MPALVQDLAPARRTVERVLAVFNPKAGSVGRDAGARLEEILGERSISGRVLACAAPGDLSAAIDEARDVDALIVLGGDGTARAALECAGPDGPPLVVLPGGTMNVLPHALYGPGDWPEALIRALDEGRVQDLPGARADGHVFFVAGIFGSPALAATAREAIREGRIVTAISRAQRAWRRAFARRLRARADAAHLRRVEAVAIIAPLVSRAGLTRMETAYIDPAGALSAFRLGIGALSGGWRDDPATEVVACDTADIFSRGLTPAILDGEPISLGPHVKIDVTARAARVLAPPLAKAVPE